MEMIAMCPEGEPEQTHYIHLSKGNGMFTVSYCCNPDWGYSFYMDGLSDYERVKFNIMNAVFECDDVDELLEHLSEVFEDGFSDILMTDEIGSSSENSDTDNNYMN